MAGYDPPSKIPLKYSPRILHNTRTLTVERSGNRRRINFAYRKEKTVYPLTAYYLSIAKMLEYQNTTNQKNQKTNYLVPAGVATRDNPRPG